jgi:hypothetical protein
MLVIVRALRALPLASLVLLASCGGSGGAGQAPATTPIVIGEPAPAPDTVRFLNMAREANCADTRNRMYVIDNKFIFWDKAGNCADASYAHALFGAATAEPLCSAGDSIAGPMTRCADEAARPMFATIVRNLDARDLGLGPAHTVRELDVPKNGGDVAYTELSRSGYSNYTDKAELVIRDGAAFDAMWARHVNGQTDKPVVNFERHMVIAVFGGAYSNGCHSLGIESIKRVDRKIHVSLVHSQPAPDAPIMCTQAIVFPAQMVVLEKSADEVSFSTQTRYYR